MGNEIDGLFAEFPTSLMRCLTDEDEYRLETEELKKLFEPTICEILDLVDLQFEQHPNIKTVFLVGGFSQSPYLKSRVTEYYKSQGKLTTTVPLAAEAIMMGAVFLGLPFPHLLWAIYSAITQDWTPISSLGVVSPPRFVAFFQFLSSSSMPD